MSSSTVLTESWIHMQQHGFKKEERGKYARSTASSRSRASLKEDSGMSQSGIYEAFAEAANHKPKTTKLDTRRKSTTSVEIRKTTPSSLNDSPRLNSINTTKDNTTAVKKLLNQRRQTLSAVVNNNENTGLIKLADTLRDTLAAERKLAQQELGIYTKKQTESVNDIITNAKRRSSMTKEKLLTLEKSSPRRRTLSTGNGAANIITQQSRSPGTTSSYMKPTLADQQRRASVTTNRNSSSPRRRKSNMIQQKELDSSSSITSEDDRNTSPIVAISALKRRSILAAATAKARQQQQQQHSPDLDDTITSSGDEKSKATPRLRKKSFATEPDLYNRRFSRTESLKEGLPTSPSIAAKVITRRKSLVKQQDGNTTADEQTPKKTVVRKRGKTLPGSLAKPPTVQSLQLPPMKVEPIKLNIPKPTTKSTAVLKGTTSTSRQKLAKKRMSTNTTPIPASSSSSSSAEASVTVVTPPKKSLSTRKLKGQSHLGISSRRASLKAPSSVSVVTPPLKSSPVSVSPRVQPRSTRRQSLAVLDTNTEQKKLSNSRKNSLVEDAGRHRAISLKEKLEAMVAEHAIHEDNHSLTATEYLAHRSTRKSQTYDTMMDTAEERARPQRIKDTLMMWDKEMVEAFSPGIPKTPSMAIKFYGHHLSPFEQTEIQGYPEVYFVGHHAKKLQAMPDNPASNYGYDDERGDYKSVTNDHLAYRYEILEELGRGSFGQVVKCYDHKTATTVAVKLIRNKKRFYAQAKTEVKILSDLVKWDPEDRHHNVKMTDNFYFRNHLCIACECLSMNLYEFIKINNFQGFHITLIKRFTIQLLRSLSLLARHGVIHCDLKPENILLKHPTKSTIKVIDFGSSCLESQRVYTYIQSRFYRSPEIILGLDYTKAIDMWSLGCIIAELYTGVPIFPGENEQEQLACIMEVMGVPEIELINSSERRHLFFDRRGEPRVVSNSRGKKRRAGTKSLGQVLRCNDPLFLDFIQQCLHWDPTKRLSPEKAFQHEWIAQSTKPPPTPSVKSSPVPANIVNTSEKSSIMKQDIPLI